MYDVVIVSPAGIVLNLSPTFELLFIRDHQRDNSQQVHLHSGVAISYFQGDPAEAARFHTFL